MKQTDDWKLLVNTPERNASVVAEFRQAVTVTRGKVWITDAAKETHIAALRAESQKRLANIQAQAEEAKVSVKRQIATALEPPKRSEQAQIAHEISKSRAWDRSLRVIEKRNAGKAEPLGVVRTLAQDAAARRDLVTLEVLREEVPAHLMATHNEEISTAAMNQIEDAFYSQATPAQRDAIDTRKALDKGWNHLSLNFDHSAKALNSLRDGSSTPITSPVFTVDFGGELMTYDAVPESTPEGENPNLEMPVLGAQY